MDTSQLMGDSGIQKCPGGNSHIPGMWPGLGEHYSLPQHLRGQPEQVKGEDCGLLSLFFALSIRGRPYKEA